MRCIPSAQERTQRIRVQRKVHRGVLCGKTRRSASVRSLSEMESERAHHTSRGHQIILPVTEFAFSYWVPSIAQIGGVYTQFPFRGTIARAQADGGKAVRRRGVAPVQKPRSGVIHIDAAQKPALRRIDDAKRRE